MLSKSIDATFSLQLNEFRTTWALEPLLVQKMERALAIFQHILETAQSIKKDFYDPISFDKKKRLEGSLKLTQLQLLNASVSLVVKRLFKNFEELTLIKQQSYINPTIPSCEQDSSVQCAKLFNESDILFKKVFDLEKSISMLAVSKNISTCESSFPAQITENPCIPRFPSFPELIARFGRRPVIISQKIESAQDCTCASFAHTATQHIEDMTLLEMILRQHNAQFGENNSSPQAFQSSGWMEKIELDEGSHFFVRADLHGDLFTLVSSILALRNYPGQPFVDENFRCHPNFHVFFLGDFMDRGDNEIPVLTLLLKWRMENPRNVHLIRGNHESVGIHLCYSNERDWAMTNDDLLTDCYKTFSLSSFVGSKTAPKITTEAFSTACSSGKEKQQDPSKRKYIHLVHGCCTTLYDPIPFLESSESRIEVRKDPPSKRRLTVLARSVGEGSLSKRQEAARLLLRGRELELKILEAQKKPPHKVSVKRALLWNDIGDDADLIAPNNRRSGVKVSPQLLQAYLHSGSDRASVGCIIRGHQHHYSEVTGKNGKVIATTLPVAPRALRSEEDSIGLSIQGLLVTVAPNIKDYKKRPLYFLQKELRFAFGEESPLQSLVAYPSV